MSAAFDHEDAERRTPPATRITVALFRDRGHSVSIRLNRHGSLRYRLDGGRETDALSLSRRYAKIYEANCSRSY